MAYFGNEPAKVAVKVGSGVITATELADDSITTADIIDDAITPNQLDEDGTGFQVGTLGVGAPVSGGHALLVSGTSSISGNATIGGAVGVGGVNATTYSNNGDNFVIYEASTPGMTIAGGTNNVGRIFFADEAHDTNNGGWAGYMDYSHSTNKMSFGTANVEALGIDSSQNATFTGMVRIGATASSPSYSSDANMAIQIHAPNNEITAIDWTKGSTNADDLMAYIGHESRSGVTGGLVIADTRGGTMQFITGAYSSQVTTLKLDSSNNATFAGDLNLTTANSKLGIGKTASSGWELDIETSSGNANARLKATATNQGARLEMDSHSGDESNINFASGGSAKAQIVSNVGNSNLLFKTNGTTTALTLDSSQNATFAGHVTTKSVESVLNGSDSATAGSYLRCTTASGDLNVWMWQLGASNQFDLWNYNAGGDNAWEKALTFTTTNLNATFYGSEITLGNGTAAQSNKLTTGDGIYASTNYDPDQYYLAWNYSNKGGTESVGVSSRASWIWKGVTSTSGNYLELRHRAGSAAAGTQNSVVKFDSSQNAEFAGDVVITKASDGHGLLHVDSTGNGNAYVRLDAGNTTRHPELQFAFAGTNYWTVKSDPDRSHDFVIRDDVNSSAVQLRIAQSTGNATFAGAINLPTPQLVRVAQNSNANIVVNRALANYTMEVWHVTGWENNRCNYRAQVTMSRFSNTVWQLHVDEYADPYSTTITSSDNGSTYTINVARTGANYNVDYGATLMFQTVITPV